MEVKRPGGCLEEIMSKKMLILVLFILAIIENAAFSFAYAKDCSESESASENEIKTAYSQQLEDILIRFQEEKVIKADQELAQSLNQLKMLNLNSTEDEIYQLRIVVDRNQTSFDDAVALFDKEKNKITEQIKLLTDQQIIALNVALNTSINNGHIVDMDSAILKKLIDEHYTNEQILSLTQSRSIKIKSDNLSEKYNAFTTVRIMSHF